MLDLTELTLDQLRTMRSMLTANIRRARNGYLYWMQERWEEMLPNVEAEISKRSLTVIK